MKIFSLDKFLDPAESLGELYFGLIMALSFTLGASAVSQNDPAIAQTALLAALGCNLAWGVIDAAMFLMGRLYERSRWARLHRQILAAGDEQTRTGMLSQLLRRRLALGPEDSAAEIEGLARSLVILAKERPLPSLAPTREDLAAAGIVCLLVAGCAVWAALPALFLADQEVVLRLSNALSIFALFVIGHRWARHTHVSPWRIGAISAGVGGFLVVLAIALGG